MSEDAPSTPKDSGPVCADPDEVSETPAQVGSGSISNTNPQETESPSGSFPDVPRLTSLLAPSTPQIQESASVERTQGVPRAEDTPALQEDPGPACADPDEVSEALARPDQDGVSETPALVGSVVTSNANPQETELSSPKVPSIPQPSVKLPCHANPSE